MYPVVYWNNPLPVPEPPMQGPGPSELVALWGASMITNMMVP